MEMFRAEPPLKEWAIAIAEKHTNVGGEDE
jgi:hypothetical protein